MPKYTIVGLLGHEISASLSLCDNSYFWVVMIKRYEKGYYIFFFVKFILSLSFPYYALLFLGYFENLLIKYYLHFKNKTLW
jgi:hypothetical protein